MRRQGEYWQPSGLFLYHVSAFMENLVTGRRRCCKRAFQALCYEASESGRHDGVVVLHCNCSMSVVLASRNLYYPCVQQCHQCTISPCEGEKEVQQVRTDNCTRMCHCQISFSTRFGELNATESHDTKWLGYYFHIE